MVRFLIPQSSNKIAILGAGISGLTAAFELKKKGIDFTLFEKENRPGGWIKTSFHQGALFEWGPRSLRLTDADATLNLIDEVGLTHEIIYASPHAKTRYILNKGKLKPVRLLPLVFQLARDLFVSKSTHEDESVYDFFSRRFSPYIADHYVDPLVKGIYAGDAKALSMRSAFPKIWDMEKDSRSLLLGMLKQPRAKQTGIITLKNGLESLVCALSLRVEIQLKSEVQKLEFERGKVQIHLNDGMQEFDHVISTLPSYTLAKALPQSSLSEQLFKIPFASVGVVHLGYSKQVNPYKGFGYLVPTLEKEEILGVVFDSAVFPEQNGHPDQTRLTVMMSPSASLKEVATKTVAKHLQIQAAPDIIESYVAKHAIPQYPVGFHKLLDEIKNANQVFPQLSLLGTSFHGVSVNQAIAGAVDLVSAISAPMHR